MTPVAFLVIFCAVMAGVAFARLLFTDTDVYENQGIMFTVLGLTMLSGLWFTLETDAFGDGARIGLAVVGLGTLLVGNILLVRVLARGGSPEGV